MAGLVRGEMSKRQVIFQLAELDLPVAPRDEQAGKGLAFDLLSSAETKVITGRDNGVITLELTEADDEHREHLRQQLSEPYRTLLGHFRHEIGHYYWPILVNQPDVLDACRVLLGDDRASYATAVKSHYDAPLDNDRSWSESHISRYATMHPYEDWAETSAHYLHILDTLQSADSFGLGATIGSGANRRSHRPGAHPTRPDSGASSGDVVDNWLELSYGLNQINRSMGHDDLYPFVLAPEVIGKLAFVDHTVHRPYGSPSLNGRSQRGMGNRRQLPGVSCSPSILDSGWHHRVNDIGSETLSLRRRTPARRRQPGGMPDEERRAPDVPAPGRAPRW
jgi:hypothetical protein